MAFMNQDLKAKLLPGIKKVFGEYDVKGTVAVRDHMVLVVNITHGPIDFIGNHNETMERDQTLQAWQKQVAREYLQVNPYWYQTHFTGKALDFLRDLIAAMNVGNWDRSEAQFDHFDVGWYIDVNIGRYSKPYVLRK